MSAAAAEAKIACPNLCTVPTEVTGSSSGSTSEVRVVLHDVANVPLAFHTFTLDFSQTSLRLYDVQDPGVSVDCVARTLTVSTNLEGEASFRPRFAGSDPSPTLHLVSEGVHLGWVHARSTDLDGLGGGTGLADFATFAAGFGAMAPEPTLNFDGSSSEIPDLADFAILARELAAVVTSTYCP